MKIGTWRDGIKPLALIGIGASRMVFAFVGGMGGYFVGSHFFPRSDAWQFGLAAAGIAIGVIAWLPLNAWLVRWT